MPSNAFNESLPFILRWEGGFVDHPSDPGGRTNKGITQKVYDGWRTRRGLAKRDVKQIEDSEVHAIYEADYWLQARCNVLRRQLDLVQFDTAVNMGVGRAVRLLQRAVNCGVDGMFGSETQHAADECDLEAAMAAYCDAREAFYRRLVEANTKLKVFLKGWLNRLNALRKEVGLTGPGASPMVLGEVGHTVKVPDNPEYDRFLIADPRRRF